MSRSEQNNKTDIKMVSIPLSSDDELTSGGMYLLAKFEPKIFSIKIRQSSERFCGSCMRIVLQEYILSL